MFKALEEDIRFAEGLSPVAVEVDANGAACALKVEGQQGGEKISATLPARTILVAAGTQPNTVLAREDATHAFIDGKYFRALDEEGEPVTPERVCKPGDVRVLMYRHADGRFMSFFGDLHPSFAGNVVKAMGGAKQGYPVLTRSMEKLAGAEALAAGDPGRGQQRLARDGRAGRAADADHRRGRGRGAGRGARTSSPASSIACRTTRRARRRSTAPCSPWRASRSPAPGSTRTRACCR